ncbi:hypothetical protein [Pseudomonas leptonychotis]|jgi:hypothetical protein|uniref:Uncharacterized protein n=1 Tax=Pseudomonas leptonychotis TaxID=2448482 RepID=A0A4T1ZTY6_9PSED|nr:hypothetical protein [Pseudomonas leptonychotis]TIH06221.1 hypothetical protein D8779_20480 [Pseudomonas leptonychotis]
MENRIEPGKYIDGWHIGMAQKEVIASFDQKPRKTGCHLNYKGHFFGFDENEKLIYIEVWGKYTGTYLGIGVGSSLKQVSDSIGTPYFDSDNCSIETNGAPELRIELAPSKMDTLYELEVTDLEDINHLKGYKLEDLKISKIGIRAPARKTS